MKIIPVLAAAAALFMVSPAASAAVVPSSSSAPLVAADAPQTSVRISVGDQRGRYYQRRHHGRRAYWRRNCRSYWRHGRRVQTCRRVRYWR